MEQPELPLPAFKRPGEKGLDQEHVNWDVPGAVYIESPAAGEVLRENRVVVSGRAPEEAMVGLYVNGQKVDVQMARDGAWRFQGVPLTGSRNVLQARYFDNRGNSAYGPAVWVDLEARPAALVAKAEILAPEPAPEAFNLMRAPEGSREILLTFDGGSNANATPAILDTLKAEGVRASIFLTGEYMQRYPELVRRIASEGHVVGNHTFSHPHLTTFSFNARHNTLEGVTEEFLKSQLARTNDLFKLIAGRSMDPYWRAPFGELNRQILRWGRDAGYTHVSWTPYLDTMDWVSSPEEPMFRTPQQILAHILAQEARRPGGVDGGIVLMHLGSERKEDLRADHILPDLIAKLKAKSYRFATVDQVPGPPGNGSGPGKPAAPQP
jgi:peptidoglycan/xylan/chitin deacetylase (PgdA/CDA1 family)